VVGGIYPKQNEDRVLMQLKEAPKYLEQALLATEDKNFIIILGFLFVARYARFLLI
jgi:penicillin-binding protein 1B